MFQLEKSWRRANLNLLSALVVLHETYMQPTRGLDGTAHYALARKNPFVAQCKPDAIYIWAIVLVRGGTSKLKLESW